MSSFTSLSWSSSSRMALPVQESGMSPLSLEEPATRVLDVLSERAVLHLGAKVEIREARSLLDAAHMRWAWVVNGGELIGVIALRDFLGHQSVQRAQQLQMPWNEVPIEYLMTPLTSLPLVSLQQLRNARIGDAAATLHESGCDFLLVHDGGHIQGLVSSWGIAEKTGEPMQVYHRAASFADIVQAVTHPDEAD